MCAGERSNGGRRGQPVADKAVGRHCPYSHDLQKKIHFNYFESKWRNVCYKFKMLVKGVRAGPYKESLGHGLCQGWDPLNKFYLFYILLLDITPDREEIV